MAFWDMKFNFNNQHNADAPYDYDIIYYGRSLYKCHKPSLSDGCAGGVGGRGVRVWWRDAKGRSFPPVLKGIPKNVFEKIVLVFPIICDYMRHSTTQIYGGKLTIHNVSCRAIYSKYTTYDVWHMRFYATCRSFSHRIGRIVGLYLYVF